MHKQQGCPQDWEYCRAKSIQTLGRASQRVNWSWSQCIKSHHAQTSSGKGLRSHFWNRNIVRSILLWLRKKITGLLLCGPKSSLQIKVNFAFHLEIKVWSPEEDWRGTESKLLEVQCEDSEVSDDSGCHEICWSIVFSEVRSQCSLLPEILKHFLLPSADKLYEDADFLFQQDFSTCPQCQNHFQVVCWSWYYCAWLASKLTRPETHREYMGHCQEEN